MGTFFALLPEDPAREVLSAFARPAIDGVRWEPLERLHVTIRYFASIPSDLRAATIAAGVACASAQPSPTIVLGPTTERLGRDGTLVVPAAGATPVAAALDVALTDAGLEGELEPRGEDFYGHLTVARQRHGATISDALLTQPLAISFVARELVLIDSVPTSDGRRYEVLARAPFGGTDGAG